MSESECFFGKKFSLYGEKCCISFFIDILSQYIDVSETFSGTCNARDEYSDNHERYVLLLMLLYSSL